MPRCKLPAPTRLVEFCGPLLVLALLCLSGATAQAQERLVIPAGEETRLQGALIPDDLPLPAGLSVEGLAIFPDRVELRFREADLEHRVDLAPGAPPRTGCLPFGPLHACPQGACPTWLRDYLDERLHAGAADEAAAAWRKHERPRSAPTPASVRVARQVFHGPGLGFGLFAAALWLLVASLGLWRNRALLLYRPPAGFAQQWREGWLWLLVGVLAFSLLATIFQTTTLAASLGWLRRAWIADDGHRALAVHAIHALFWLTALVLFLRAARQHLSALWRLPLFWAATLLVVAPHLAVNVTHMDPASIFIEWQAPVWLAAGSLPSFEHYLMGVAAPAAWILKLVGHNATGVNVVRLLAALLWISGLVAATWSATRSRRAIWLVPILALALPIMPFLATEGWWFMAGIGVALLALAAMEEANRNHCERWGFLALLLTHLAVEVRLEGIALLLVWLALRHRNGRISRRLDRVASLVFSINLLRLAAITVGGDRVGWVSVDANLSNYLSLVGDLWPWAVLSAWGFWFFWKFRPENALRLLLLTLGWWGIHLLAQTAPSHRELLTLFAPLLVLSGGLVLTQDASAPRLRRLLPVGLVLVLALAASWPVRQQWQGWRERADQLGKATHASLAHLPADLPLLLDPIYLRLTAPDRERLLETPRRIYLSDLRAALEGRNEVICLNDLNRADACCFFEVDPGPLGEEASDPAFSNRRCWLVEALGWWPRPLHQEGPLTALRLIRPPEASP